MAGMKRGWAQDAGCGAHLMFEGGLRSARLASTYGGWLEHLHRGTQKPMLGHTIRRRLCWHCRIIAISLASASTLRVRLWSLWSPPSYARHECALHCCISGEVAWMRKGMRFRAALF
eukprot:12400058-Karenia_brevis.AAC.1